LISPYAIEEGDADAEAKRALEIFAEDIEFRVTNTAGANLNVRVYRGGTDLGSIDFTVDVTRRDRVTWATPGASAGPAVDQDYQGVLALCQPQRGWLRIWYESGHTLSGKALYSMRYRDVSFGLFQWEDLAGYDVTIEKPDPLTMANVGLQGSLFCWVKNVWPKVGNQGGWLACDDRPLEMADFVHLDDVSDPPILSLLHAKKSHSDAANRQASLPHFETVVGQAIKNLRYLDRAILASGMRKGVGSFIGNFVWRNRAASTRNAMLAALNAVGANYRRRVVIVLPSLTNAEMNTPVAAMNPQRALRFRQVNTLLTASEVTCRSMGAEFVVIGEQ
jgi:hypothetical protein